MCLDAAFFQWHVHWTMVGLTGSLPGSTPGEPGNSPEAISACASHTVTQILFSLPLLVDLLPAEVLDAAPLAFRLQTFSRTAQFVGTSDRVRFCVWTC